ncbi:LacI family transcriptional regulator [Spirosoma oryzae]|uniref:LacI family transcriptional regulator n=2 Tax=Spirosoma oryzae TaxID=1469603 RepID=A0A2T0SAJ7_9BACT|nr:LacI family transcriptional regulator [Spirosoma oryzae]
MPEIHPDTRKAVIRLAEELDYQPNQLAKNLVKSRTKTIGVIFPNLSYHYFSAMLNNLEEAVMQAGYSVLVAQTNESYVRETISIQNLLRSQVEGLVLSLSRDTADFEHVERLVRKGVPIVLVDRTADIASVSKVTVDNRAAAFKATEHLIGQGCQRIGFLAGPPQLSLSQERVDGYLAAAAQYNAVAGNQYIRHCDYTNENTILQTLALMSLPYPPDGIVAISDRIAYPALYAIQQKGLSIPKDVAVVSFNNEPVSAYVSPTLSSINQPITEMATETVRLLLRQIEAPEVLPFETKVFDTQLIIRESSLRNRLDY